MKRLIASVLIVAFAASATLADGNAIAQRRALMKANGEAAGKLVAILKGAPYDDAAVHAALKTFVNASEKMPKLFPADSKTGGETAALPAIWENKADLDARFVKLGADANAASLSIKDADTFKASIPGVFQNCGGCHELYKVKQS